jgi:2'-5' RNA ligase
MSDLLAQAKRLKAAENESGIMIAFQLNRQDAVRLAVAGGEEPADLHVTLAYLGDAASLGGYRELLTRIVRLFAKAHAPVSGTVNGNGRFTATEGTGKVAQWAYFDAPLLPSFRQRLVDGLLKAGVPYRPSYGFVPHITLAYTEADAAALPPSPTFPIRFDAIQLHWGNQMEIIPLNNSAPNYTTAKDGRDCGTCAQFKNEFCTQFNLGVSRLATCDVWQAQGNIEEAEEPVAEAIAEALQGDDGRLLTRAKLLTSLKNALADDTVTASKSFAVFKDSNGRYRWITRSSNSFRDRDGEIVSTKALADDVARADADGDYGPLRFWHMPGVDVGDCDFNWLRGRTLLESGTFRNEQVAEKVAANADGYQISIGFKHPPDNPDKAGVYHQIRRFERSLVPAGRAANPFTSLMVKELDMSKYDEKLATFKNLLADDDLMAYVLKGATEAEKAADAMGVVFKGVDLNSLNEDDLLEVAIARKEAKLELKGGDTAKKMEEEKSDPEEDKKKPAGSPDIATKMGDYMTKMGGYMDRMEKMFGETKKEAANVSGTVAAVQEASVAQSGRIAELEKTIKSLGEQLGTAVSSLKELQSDVPAGILKGVRPSQSPDTVVADANNLVEKSLGGNGVVVNADYDQFLNNFLGGV